MQNVTKIREHHIFWWLRYCELEKTLISFGGKYSTRTEKEKKKNYNAYTATKTKRKKNANMDRIVHIVPWLFFVVESVIRFRLSPYRTFTFTKAILFVYLNGFRPIRPHTAHKLWWRKYPYGSQILPFHFPKKKKNQSTFYIEFKPGPAKSSQGGYLISNRIHTCTLYMSLR